MEERAASGRYSFRGDEAPGPQPVEISDRTLVQRAQRGDAEAVAELYVRYRRRLLNYLYRFTGNRHSAEELTQETFVRVVRFLPLYRPTGSVGGWIYRLARNLVLSAIRHEKVAKEVPLEEPFPSDAGEEGVRPELPDPAPWPDERAGQRELERAVQEALSKLAPAYREAVILCDIQGHAYREAAEILEVPIDTVASRLARGRAKLAVLLKQLERERGQRR